MHNLSIELPDEKQVVITGGTGRLARSLRNLFPQAAYPSRHQLDLLDEESVGSYIASARPRLFVHAAAMTDVRLAQTEQRRCWETNVAGTERIVMALQRWAPDCYFVYVSTACVFQGDRGNYSESDIPYPKNFYGLSKLVGEYVARRMPQHLIIRTNFVAREPWPFPKAFVDRYGTYLFADDVAVALQELIANRTQGLVHIAGDRRLSMYDLARLTSPEVGKLSVADVDLALTVDMTLISERIKPKRIGSAVADNQALVHPQS